MLCSPGSPAMPRRWPSQRSTTWGAVKKELHRSKEMVDEAISILENAHPLDCRRSASCCTESWNYNAAFPKKVSTPEMTRSTKRRWAPAPQAARFWAQGGGGFLLLFVKPQLQARWKAGLKHLIHVPFGFETSAAGELCIRPTDPHPSHGRPTPRIF